MREEGDAAALAERIAEFKSDPEKLQEVTQFLNEMLELAESRADSTRRETESKEVEEAKFFLKSVSDGNLQAKRQAQDKAAANAAKRRLGSRARGFMVRLFEVLCNCSQTAAAAARTHTESLRASKR